MITILIIIVLLVAVIGFLPILPIYVPEGRGAVIFRRYSPYGGSAQPIPYQIKRDVSGRVIELTFRGSGYKPHVHEPGLRFFARCWFIDRVQYFDWVSVGATEVAYIISQIGEQLPTGRRFVFLPKGVSVNIIQSVGKYIMKVGKIGELAPVLTSFTKPLHPAAFLVVTKSRVYGIPYNPALRKKQEAGQLSYKDFGFTESDFDLTVVHKDKIGLITIHDGRPMPEGLPAYRYGGWSDFVGDAWPPILDKEGSLPAGWSGGKHAEVCKKYSVEIVPWSKPVGDQESDWDRTTWLGEEKVGRELLRVVMAWDNKEHNNYTQLDEENTILGPQLTPILEGSYAYNRHLISVEEGEPVVVPGHKALAIVAAVGPVGHDITPPSFTFNPIVRPGFTGGIWSVALGPGPRYIINQRFHEIDLWNTSLMVLYWSEHQSEHGFDEQLKPIRRLSKDNVWVTVDLNIKIAVPAEAVPFCKARFGSQKAMINDYLQAEVTSWVMDFIERHTADEILSAQEKLGKELRTHLIDRLTKYHIDVREVLFEMIEPEDSYYKVVNARTLAEAKKATTTAEKELAVIETDRNKQQGIAKAATTLEEARGEVEARKLLIQAVKEVLGDRAANALVVAQELVSGKHPGMPTALAITSDQAADFLSTLPFISQSANEIKEAIERKIKK